MASTGPVGRHRTTSWPVFRLLREAKNKAELEEYDGVFVHLFPPRAHILGTCRTHTTSITIIEEGFNTLTQRRTFVYFTETAYQPFLNAYFGTTHTPKTYLYVLGNPLIAQTMLKHDLTGAHIPPSLLVTEKAGGDDTRIVYDDPATTIPVPATQGGPVNADLQAATEQLSQKLEELVKTVFQ